MSRAEGTEAYAALVAARAPALLRLALMLTGDRSEAEDLLQATLVRTQRHAERIAAMAAPAAYLRKAMLHEHLSGVRRLGRRVRETPLAAHDFAVDPTPSTDLRDETWRLLATLPPRQRAVLVLRFYEDLPDREIGEALRCAESRVRSNASRALATLRARLTENEEARP